jgi:beta-glucosidase
MRNPKAGRAWERYVYKIFLKYPKSSSHESHLDHSFGPDPYLSGEGAYETIVGVQSVGVQACAKHFLANNQEHWRYGLSANLDDRTIHEVYFYPFLRSIEVSPPSLYF